MTNTKAQTAGFRVEEIYRAFDGGDRVAAVKMLRAETGCGLKEAMDSLNGRCIETLPSFEEAARRKRIERAAPELLAALKLARTHIANTPLDHVIVSLDHPDVGLGEYLDNAITRATVTP